MPRRQPDVLRNYRPTRREIMQYIVDNANRYNRETVESAQRYLDRGYSTSNPRVSEYADSTSERRRERSSTQRSAARRRRPAGMSSRTTRSAVERGTGLSRMSVSDSARLRSMADSYAAFGWGT